MKPGGKLLLTVPSGPEYCENYVEYYGYEKRYNLNTINKRLINRDKFDIEKIRFIKIKSDKGNVFAEFWYPHELSSLLGKFTPFLSFGLYKISEKFDDMVIGSIICLTKKDIKKPRKKILVLSTYSVYPPRGGGQHRLYNLYKNLSKHFDITVLAIVEYDNNYSDRILQNGLREICIPQSKEHAEKQREIEKKTGLNLFDVAMIENVSFSKNYVTKVDKFLPQSDIIISSHPYLFDLAKRVNEEQVIVYDSIDVEYTQKSAYIKKSKIESDLANRVKDIEEKACKESDIVFATSEEEREELSGFYGISEKKIAVVPNGVDTHEISFVTEEEHEEQKALLGIKRPTILFVGSWHPPNLEAMEFIVNDLARRNKHWIFYIIGSIKDYYIASHHLLKKLPKNVLAFGVVEEEEKYELYKIADVAINPMFSGSGTNLKMLDYMSAGIPIVSTRIGARGLELVNENEGLISSAELFEKNIKILLEDHKLREKIRNNAREKVEKHYDWKMIAEKASGCINSALKGDCSRS